MIGVEVGDRVLFVFPGIGFGIGTVDTIQHPYVRIVQDDGSKHALYLEDIREVLRKAASTQLHGTERGPK